MRVNIFNLIRLDLKLLDSILVEHIFSSVGSPYSLAYLKMNTLTTTMNLNLLNVILQTTKTQKIRFSVSFWSAYFIKIKDTARKIKFFQLMEKFIFFVQCGFQQLPINLQNLSGFREMCAHRTFRERHYKQKSPYIDFFIWSYLTWIMLVVMLL